MKNKWIGLWIALLAIVLHGCGGGGGTGGGSTTDVSFFATDNLNAGYDGVWVKVLKAELRKSDDTFTTVFNDADGRVINLRALSDGSARYAYFGFKGVTPGTFTGMRFTFDRAVTLFPTGATNGQQRVFDDIYGTPNAVIGFLFNTPKSISSASDIIVDFDLSAWEDVSGEIRNAVIQEGNGSGFGSPDRHESDDYQGTISGLTGTAPNQIFVLSSFAGTKIEVETTSTTTVFNNNGSLNPTLANGVRVEVRGQFNPSTQRLVAQTIKIKNSSDDDEFEVKGSPQSANSGARTFVVSVRESEGFIPTQSTVNVVVNDNTRFFTDRGVAITEAAFFALLPTDIGFEVEVEGTSFNSGNSTLTASKCKIEDESGSNSGGAEAKGAPTAISSGAGTFGIVLAEWEGFSSSVGTIVNVTTSGGTEFKDANGASVSKSAFFELLATAVGVKVEGPYENGTISAREARIRSTTGGGGGGGGGGNDPHEINGTISNINSSNRTFTVTIFEWSGFGGSLGLQVNVTMNSNATYRNDDGDSITQEQFFAALGSSPLVEVEGTYNSGNQTFTGVKAKLDND